MANSLREDLTKKYVVLKQEVYRGDVIDRVFFCSNGFGCISSTIGSGVFGKFVSDNRRYRVEGFEIERFASEEEVKGAEERFASKEREVASMNIGKDI